MGKTRIMAHEDPDVNALEQISVLLVEDDSIAREQLGEMLADDIGEVLEAGNGKEALELFLEKAPDIVVMDIQMPMMDGLELCRKIKDTHPKTPIVIMTAHHDEAYLLKAIRLGVKDYLFKPISSHVLIQRLQEIARSLLFDGEIQKREQIINSLLNANKNIVLLTDGKTPLRCNQAFLDFFGLSDLESFTAKHRSLGALFLDRGEAYLSFKDSVEDAFWIARFKSSLNHQERVIMAAPEAGEEHTFLVDAALIDNNENPEQFIVSLIDITKQDRNQTDSGLDFSASKDTIPQKKG